MTEHTRRGARGFILPAGHAPGNPAENRLLPQTAAELSTGAARVGELRAQIRFTLAGRLPQGGTRGDGGPTVNSFTQVATARTSCRMTAHGLAIA